MAVHKMCIEACQISFFLSDIAWLQQPHSVQSPYFDKPWFVLMSPAELSSIKWEQDGEMSAQDIWSLVKKLTKVEEHDKASNLLHLSSKHSHSKRSNRR